MKRTKRYNGDDSSVTSSDRDTDTGVDTDTSKMGSANPAPTNFKSAFAAARGAGDKTFEFGGKKYTTELASPKPTTTSKAVPETETKSAPAATSTESTTKTSTPSTSKDTYRTLSGKIETKKSSADRDAENAARREKTIEAVKSVGSGIGSMFNKAIENYKSTVPRYNKEKKMASGGMTASSRADGIAMRGKTRGKYC
jgi:hypothetical protein